MCWRVVRIEGGPVYLMTLKHPNNIPSFIVGSPPVHKKSELVLGYDATQSAAPAHALGWFTSHAAPPKVGIVFEGCPV